MQRIAMASPEPKATRYRISIHSASDLEDTDLIGKSDPYCKVFFDGSMVPAYQTKVVKNCLDPVWEESFEATRHSELLYVTVEVFDHDRLRKDDRIGAATVSCRPSDLPVLRRTARLVGRKGDTSGHVCISVELLPC
eukprot:TRINITY_DN16830_c0_g1_i1.p1 TRINITY_DN16830_c0_g1~~TRINITY_DN16830_c0_g1_i1.p1  ORF type:complete len:137 (+),score=35.99 TRINITY_DN16830_c0_g1_i1:175-585(+)